MFACFFGGPCFQPNVGRLKPTQGKDGASAAEECCWHSVPDDVLHAMLAYLSPRDIALARLVSRHWRTTLSCYTPALTLPTSVLACKGARAMLRNTAQHFPSVNRLNLCHAGGWCDPVQARMDVEPLVRQERRSGTLLEPVAAAFSQIQQLCVSDATFTRDPWSLDQLSLLPKLSCLNMTWDTGLWAPGQVAQEADALQAVYSRTQLTSLQLSKHAHLFLGEVPLGDTALASAAHLRCLLSLDLATVGVSDDGFGALGALTSLTALSLRGHIAVSLGTLSKVFRAVTGLQSLSLAGLLPSSRDLKRIAAAYGGGGGGGSASPGTRHRAASRHSSRHIVVVGGGGGAGSSGSGSASSSFNSSSGGGSMQHNNSLVGSYGRSPQQQLPQQYHSQVGGAGGAWRSSRLWEQQSPTQQRQQHQPSSALPPIPTGAAGAAAGGSSSSVQHRQQQQAAAAGGGGSNQGGSGSSRGRFRASDWSIVLLPLRRLKVLKLQSDYAFLGSCAALRSMGHVTHVELHGSAKYMHLGPQLQQSYGALPPSWLTQLARDAAAASLEERNGGASSSSSGGGSSRGMLRAGGAWPGLVGLHIDHLQLADGFIQGLAQLVNLKTVIIAGPCLLAAQQHHQQQQGRGWVGGPQRGGQQAQQQAQQPHSESAPGWSSAFAGLASGSLSELPALSGLSGGQEGFSNSQAKTLDGWRSDGLASPAALAAGLVAAAAKAKLSPGSHGSGSSSATSTTTTTTSTSTSSGSSRSSAPLFATSGMRVQLQPEHQPVTATLAALQLQQQQQGGAGHHHGLFRPVLDADVLTRLSPLTQLGTFELHLQQHMPCGLSMTPFALAHLAVSWAGLTSLSLNIPAPTPRLTAAPSEDGSGSAQECAAGQLFSSLNALTSLQHLHLHMTDATPPGAGSQPPAFPGAAALPATPEHVVQPFAELHHNSSGSMFAIDSGTLAASAAAATAVAELPWHLLPASLMSLSLSGFVGLQTESIQALASAAPSLRHLRLMYCQVPTSVLWGLRHFLPGLHTLVVKEDALGGIGSSGVAAIATLGRLRALAVTLEDGADVAVLGQLEDLRHLLLDGRSNTEVRGVKGLGQLSRLKTLIMPLLQLHYANQTLLSTLQLSLPNTHIMHISRNFGRHHGCQWFKCFTPAERQWWAQPAQPWTWRPTLDILP